MIWNFLCYNWCLSCNSVWQRTGVKMWILKQHMAEDQQPPTEKAHICISILLHFHNVVHKEQCGCKRITATNSKDHILNGVAVFCHVHFHSRILPYFTSLIVAVCEGGLLSRLPFYVNVENPIETYTEYTVFCVCFNGIFGGLSVLKTNSATPRRL